MSKSVFVFFGFILCNAGPVLAASADPMAIFYKNTVEGRRGNETPHLEYFNADHTFTDVENGKVIGSGTWTYRADGDKVCLTIDMSSLPPGHQAPPQFCKDAHTDAKVGQGWPDSDQNGAVVHKTLVAGRK